MTKKYHTGLVVGKFAPFHIGHRYLIQTALDQCVQLVIIAYGGGKYGFSSSTALAAIKFQFPGAKLHTIDGGRFNAPPENAPEEDHRLFCAKLLADRNLSPGAVFSSEEYGQPFSQFLGQYFGRVVDNVVVDIARETYPVSGTALRAGNLDWDTHALVNPVCDYRPVSKVLFLGGESSGKTTLATAMGKLTNCPVVLEYGREYGREYGNSEGPDHYTYESMEHISITQSERELTTYLDCNHIRPYMFCDTNSIVTAFYSLKWYNKVSPWVLGDASKIHRYQHIFLLCNDFPFEEESGRSGIEFANQQYEFYHEFLQASGVKYTVLSGSLQERIGAVLNEIRKGRK